MAWLLREHHTKTLSSRGALTAPVHNSHHTNQVSFPFSVQWIMWYLMWGVTQGIYKVKPWEIF